LKTIWKKKPEKKAEFKAGRSIGLSGREMFTFRPEMAIDDQTEDDEVAFDTSKFAQENGDDDAIRELTLENIMARPTSSNETGITKADRLQISDYTNHVEESQKLGVASGGSDQGETSESPAADVPIDEDLFAEDDEDLDELEESLENLDINA